MAAIILATIHALLLTAIFMHSVDQTTVLAPIKCQLIPFMVSECIIRSICLYYVRLCDERGRPASSRRCAL